MTISHPHPHPPWKTMQSNQSIPRLVCPQIPPCTAPPATMVDPEYMRCQLSCSTLCFFTLSPGALGEVLWHISHPFLPMEPHQSPSTRQQMTGLGTGRAILVCFRGPANLFRGGQGSFKSPFAMSWQGTMAKMNTLQLRF